MNNKESVPNIPRQKNESQQSKLYFEMNAMQEMREMLIQFQSECIRTMDIAGAKQTRTKINDLIEKQEMLRQKMIHISHDKQSLELTIDQEDILSTFDTCWNQYLNDLINELAHSEDTLRKKHKAEIEKIVNKMQNEKIKGFKPSAKLSNLRLKVIGLMKMHRYEESELQSVELKELQRLQRSCWQQKVQQRQKMALDVLQKKNLKEFAFLRSKNQDNLFKKMKERDTKLQTLLKKHHIKRIQIQKYHRQKIRNIHSPQINARRSQ